MGVRRSRGGKRGREKGRDGYEFEDEVCTGVGTVNVAGIKDGGWEWGWGESGLGLRKGMEIKNEGGGSDCD